MFATGGHPKRRTFFIVRIDHNVRVCDVRVALSPLNLRPEVECGK